MSICYTQISRGVSGWRDEENTIPGRVLSLSFQLLVWAWRHMSMMRAGHPGRDRPVFIKHGSTENDIKR